jgi:hypothetical protein
LKSLFTFKPEDKIKLLSEWPSVWEPLKVRFHWLAHECVYRIGTPPLVITCLARTPAENTAVGGVPASMHMTIPCRAIDIRRYGFDDYRDEMKALWESAGAGWDCIFEGAPFNKKPPHFHLEADMRVV